MATRDGLRSRRTFLKAALLGATSVVAGVGSPVQLAEARCLPNDPGCKPPPPPYQEVFAGNVTLGAILTSYVPAPLGDAGQMQWTITKTRTDTRTFSDESGAVMTVSKSVGSMEAGGFSVGSEVKQGTSTKVTNGLVIALTESQTIFSGVPTGAATIDNTGFLLLANPVLAVYDVYRFGTRSGQRAFLLSGAGTIAAWSLRELRDDPVKRGLIGANTANSLLSLYPLSSGVTSSANPGITSPRFTKLFELSLGQVPYSFARSLTVTTLAGTQQTKSISTDVKTGFLGFGAGHTTTITYTSIEEIDNSTVITSQGTLTSAINHFNGVYQDNLFNTLLITDDGPLSGRAAAVEGVVTAPDGSPVAGAVVTLSAGGSRFVTVSGPDGRYAIHTSTPVPPGAHTVQCAGVSRIAMVGAGPARIDYAGVDRELARVTAD